MSVAPQLFTKHRSMAFAIAKDFSFPGAGRDDVQQEALIALWVAAREYEPSRGHFAPWARICIRARLADCLIAATRHKQLVLTESVREWDAPHELDACTAAIQRERVRLIVATLDDLTGRERDALARIVNGTPLAGKGDDNARQRARVKLRAAA